MGARLSTVSDDFRKALPHLRLRRRRRRRALRRSVALIQSAGRARREAFRNTNYVHPTRTICDIVLSYVQFKTYVNLITDR